MIEAKHTPGPWTLCCSKRGAQSPIIALAPNGIPAEILAEALEPPNELLARFVNEAALGCGRDRSRHEHQR